MSVYSTTRSQLCFNWVLDYVSMRLLPSTIIWRPSVLQLLLLWHSQNHTSSNVTVPDCQCIPSQEVNCVQLGAWLCKHETAPPTQFIWRPSVPVLQLWHSQDQYMYNVTDLDVSVFHHQGVIVFQLGAWLCKHELLSLTQFIWRPSAPQCAALALTESIHVVMSLYLMSVYSIARSQLCWDWVLDYVSLRLALPHTIYLETIRPPFSSSGTHRINTRQ